MPEQGSVAQTKFNIRRIIRNAVFHVVRVIKRASEEALREKKGNRGFTGVTLTTNRAENRAEIVATGKSGRGQPGDPILDLAAPAFDVEFQVPPGGFKPQKGKAIKLVKPEGIKFRARTYSNFSGQTVKQTGFFDEALRSSYSDADRQRILNNLTHNLAKEFAHGTAHAIANHFRRKGYRVTVISRGF